ncbi:MAG TPA: lysophospholipid acyltransferase family protein [Myxococcota bacterium]
MDARAFLTLGHGVNHLQARLEYYYYLANVGVARGLPEDAARRLASGVANLLFARGGRRQGAALANLALAYPDLSAPERRRIARESWVQTAWAMLDAVRSRVWSEDELRRRVQVENLERMQQALARGRGALILTLHFGSIELAMLTLPLVGVPLTVVGRPLPNPWIRRHMAQQRTRTGAQLLEHHDVAPRILDALRQGRAVAFLNDQYARRTGGILSPFFGARCFTAPGIALLALRSGAPVLPFYIVRDAPDRHRSVFLPELELERTGEVRRDVATATARTNQTLEGIIRRYPEQWLWAHRRFRRSPDLPRDFYAA